MIVDDLVRLVSIRIHPEAHIKINQDKCRGCRHRACVYGCPAACYQWNEEAMRMEFAHESCIECGTCLVMCNEGALDWNFPKGGFGVRFRLT